MIASSNRCDESLVALQVALEHGLLQYVSQAKLWVDSAHADAIVTLQRLAAEQRKSSESLAELMASRRILPELASFPSEYAQWHYLALSYVLVKVVANQQHVVAIAADAVSACAEATAAPPLAAIAEREAGHLAELRRLGAQLQSPSAI